MNLPTPLNIALGLAVIYFALSLLASQIQELISTKLEWRADHLKKSIQNLLDRDSKGTFATSEKSLTQALYNNSLIKALNQKAEGRAKSKGPSYIPSSLFAIALMDVLKDDTNIEINNLEDVETILKGVKNEVLQHNLFVLMRRARTDVQGTAEQLQQFYRELAIWFDSSMERASGVYTRNAKGVAILIGLLIALSFNVDTLHIVRTLARGQVLDATAEQVTQYLLTDALTNSSCLQPAAPPEAEQRCLIAIRKQVNSALNSVTPLPVGWNLANPLENQVPLNVKTLMQAIAGWLLSAIAISMGAPFWFELLNKVINVRNTGKKPEKAT